MKVTDVPVQIAPVGLATTLTEGTTVGLTVIVIALDVAVVGVAQDELEFKIQVTMSPETNVELVYVVPPVPTLLPFTCH